MQPGLQAYVHVCVYTYCKKFYVVDVTPSGDEKPKHDPL